MRTYVMLRPMGLALLLAAAVPAAAAAPDVESIVRRIDELYRADNSYAKMEMRIVNPNWERTMTMQVWTQGMDKTLIRILSPAKDRGIATLRVDDEMWNYYPKIDKVMKVPPSMMMSSWMGSDFTNDDLVKESTLLEDYDVKRLEPEDAEKGFHYIEFTPKEQTPSVWARIVAKVETDPLLPVRQDYYDESDELVRTITFSERKTLGGRYLPAVMSVDPINKPKNRTVIRYLEAEFNQGVPDGTFSLRALRQAP